MTKVREPGSAHEAMAEMIKQAGGVEVAAAFEGVSVFTLYKMLDPDQGQTELSFLRVARLTAHFKARAAAHYLAQQAGCVLVQLPEIAGDGSRLGRITAQAMKECADVFSRLGAVLDDDKITRDEVPDFEREVDEAIAKLVRLKVQVRAVAAGEAK